MSKIYIIFLGIWSLCPIDLFAESLFFAARKDCGGVMVNRFPFGETWFKSNNNVSSEIGVDLLKGGENIIELVFLVSETGGSYTFQFEDSEGKKVHDMRIQTAWKKKGEGNAGELKIEWLEPLKKVVYFEFEDNQNLTLSMKEDAGNGWVWDKQIEETESASSLVTQIVVKIPYFSERGAGQMPPWVDAKRYQKEEFLEVKEVSVQYAKMLASKNIDGLEKLCDERWRWQALCRGETFSQRKEVIKKALENHKDVKFLKSEVTKVDVFPLTSLIRISGVQVGLLLDGKPIFLEFFLFKKGDKWKFGI